MADRGAGDAGRPPSWLSLALSDGCPKRSFIVALVVGSLLNLLNQGDFLLAGEPLNWWKIILTYAVPYLVATYGAVTMRQQAQRRAGKDSKA